MRNTGWNFLLTSSLHGTNLTCKTVVNTWQMASLQLQCINFRQKLPNKFQFTYILSKNGKLLIYALKGAVFVENLDGRQFILLYDRGGCVFKQYIYSFSLARIKDVQYKIVENKRNFVCERNWNGFGVLEKNPCGQNAPWKKFFWFGFIFASGEMKIRWLYTSDAPREQLTGKNTFSSPPPNSEKLYNFLDALASLESVRRVTDHFFSWDIRSMSWRDFQHYHVPTYNLTTL